MSWIPNCGRLLARKSTKYHSRRTGPIKKLPKEERRTLNIRNQSLSLGSRGAWISEASWEVGIVEGDYRPIYQDGLMFEWIWRRIDWSRVYLFETSFQIVVEKWKAMLMYLTDQLAVIMTGGFEQPSLLLGNKLTMQKTRKWWRRARMWVDEVPEGTCN